MPVLTTIASPCSDAREVHLRQDDYTVHDVATTLKRYFRSLEEPLLTTFLYAKWTNTCST